MRFMSVTRDTSHVAIGPFRPLRHLPFGDSLRHASTALLSCTLDRGVNAKLKKKKNGNKQVNRFELQLLLTEV